MKTARPWCTKEGGWAKEWRQPNRERSRSSLLVWAAACGAKHEREVGSTHPAGFAGLEGNKRFGLDLKGNLDWFMS
jgi:hypothetical protein